jgi:hypothetical protein
VKYTKVGQTEPIWQNESFSFRDEYDVGDNPANFFDREDQTHRADEHPVRQEPGLRDARGLLTRAEASTAILGTDTYLAESALEKLLVSVVGTDRESGRRGPPRRRDLVGPRHQRSTDAVAVRRREKPWSCEAADGLKGDGREGVDAYLGDPTPGVTLVLLAAKPDRRKAVWKKIVGQGDRRLGRPLARSPGSGATSRTSFAAAVSGSRRMP